MIVYCISDRTLLAGDEAGRLRGLPHWAAECARAGADYIQLREKDLSARVLESLALAVVAGVRESGSRTRVLINSRLDVALAVGADGVHLPATDISAADARAIWKTVRPECDPVITVACHLEADVALAESHGADLAVFAPVFAKGISEGVGISALRRACRRKDAAKPPIGVIALGGITLTNAHRCVQAGAVGVAAVRLFGSAGAAEAISKLKKS